MVYSMCSTPYPAVLRKWIERDEVGGREELGGQSDCWWGKESLSLSQGLWHENGWSGRQYVLLYSDAWRERRTKRRETKAGKEECAVDIETRDMTYELWGKGLQLRVWWGYRTQGWENGNKQGCDQHERQKKEWARDVEKMKQSKRNSFISCSMDHSIFYINALQIFKTDG